MKQSLQTALDNNEMVFSNLVEIADDILEDYISEVDGLVKNAVDKVETMTNDDIRLLMLKLSLKSYSFGDIKEKAALKQECAETLRKEKYAQEYNKAEGKLGEKENIALLNSSDEVLVETIYNMIASTMKTKNDEIHRIVDTLKSILVSRAAEAKIAIMMNGTGMEEDNE